MKKKIIFLLAALVVFGGISVQYVTAEEKPSLKSHGNIIYKSDEGTVMLFAEDLALLRSKIFSISEDMIDQEEGGEE